MFFRRSAQLLRGPLVVAAAPLVAASFSAPPPCRAQEEQPKSSSWWRNSVNDKKKETAAPSLPIVEPRTNVQFPESLSSHLKLAGCGVRLKFGILPIYAVALYAPEAVRSVNELGHVDTAVRTVLVRTLSAQAFVKAIEDQLKSRVTDAGQIAAFVDACVAAMPDQLSVGTTTTLSLSGAGGVVIAVDDKDPQTIRDVPQVASALLDVYVGEDAVSPTARTAILHTFAARK